ncbi:MAG: tetratricopeptide repeat protein [Candidatus Krumholzibacteriota bacterium]|nr:tetratricopeptide repeat protein [Candidatus Krumholzibacteriota bacterium]
MIDTIMGQLGQVQWAEVLRLFIDVTLKGTVICAGAAIATLVLSRSSAFVRNAIWVSVLLGLVLLPVLSLITPVWNLPLLPEPGSWNSARVLGDFEYREGPASAGPPVVTPGAGTAEKSITGKNIFAGTPWYIWVFAVWMAGVVIHICWCLVSWVAMRRFVLNCAEASHGWKDILGDVAGGIGLNRTVRLLESKRIKAAMTTGIFNPVVIVPADSGDWPETHRRLVLSHELVHVKRWDALIEIFTLIVTVIYWFNPVILFAVRQLRIERERDCDDAVLCAGAKPSDYAELLMEIASDLSGQARPVWQLSTISQSSNLKERLMNILNTRIDRKRGSRRVAVVTAILVLMITVPLSTSGLWNSQAVAQTEKEKKEKTEQMEKEKKLEIEKKKKMLEAEKMKNMTEEEKKAYAEQKKQAQREKIMGTWEKISADENSAAAIVGKAIKKKGLENGIKVFQKLKSDGQENIYFKEGEFNTLGYVFLYHEKPDEAIGVFKLNVEEYPDSWNTYDSLGEAYLASGNIEKAKKYYQKSLQINPENKNGQMVLQKIQKKMEMKKEKI